MSDRLPPLTALRAFEAAARHLSFAAAAEELGVTPAALSFQIKSLETHLGQPVFLRLNRRVELTPAGRTLAPGTSEGFDRLTAAWRAARRLGSERRITVTAGPAFTAKWLAPRMFGFAAAHPEIELRFVAGLKLMEFGRDEIDVAIRFGFGPDTGLYSEPLIAEWLTPMATPEIAARLSTPADLGRETLLHADDTLWMDPPVDWAAWARAEGLDIDVRPGPRFSQADHALDAALGGAGVVLARISLAAGDLATGRLIAPFETALATEANYRFVCESGSENRPQIRTFREWLAGEVAGLDALAEGRRMVASSDVSPDA